MRLEGERPATARAARHIRPARSSPPGSPYLLLVVFVLVWGDVDVKRAIDQFTNGLLPRFLAAERDGR